MSVGYDFDPDWFACGQSPLCVVTFLSILREFIGRPEEVKRIFRSAAIDLKREK